MKQVIEVVLKLRTEESHQLTIDGLKNFKSNFGYELLDENNNIVKKAIAEDSECQKASLIEEIEKLIDCKVEEIISFDNKFEIEDGDKIYQVGAIK